MRKSKRLIIILLAIAAGAGGAGNFCQQAHAGADSLLTLCFRSRTIQVPFYLRDRYIFAGAMDGPCPTSHP